MAYVDPHIAQFALSKLNSPAELQAGDELDSQNMNSVEICHAVNTSPDISPDLSQVLRLAHLCKLH